MKRWTAIAILGFTVLVESASLYHEKTWLAASQASLAAERKERAKINAVAAEAIQRIATDRLGEELCRTSVDETKRLLDEMQLRQFVARSVRAAAPARPPAPAPEPPDPPRSELGCHIVVSGGVSERHGCD